MTRRNWNLAHEKVILEESRCRVCRSREMVECAHITGRTHDVEPPLRDEGWRPGVVHPDRIVPLCKVHHQDYDAHLLDLIPYLQMWEVLQAVADSASGRSNGFESARKRLIGNEEIAA